MRSFKTIWKTLVAAIELFFAKKSFQASGALAFYTLISMAPLLIIVITLVGVFLGDEAVRGEVVAQLEGLIGSDAAKLIQDAVRQSRIEQSGIGPTVLGAIAVVFGATTVFAQLRSSLNYFWDVRAKPSRNDVWAFVFTRLVSFGMVLTIGFLLLTSFLISIALATAMEFAEGWIPVPDALVVVADTTLSLLIMTALFGLIFRVLPDVRLSWKDVGRGSFLTAVLFIVGQSLISLYLTRTGAGSAYGAAGSLVVVLFWVYYSSLILHFGTAVTRALVMAEGGQIRPIRGAVRIRTEIVKEENASIGEL